MLDFLVLLAFTIFAASVVVYAALYLAGLAFDTRLRRPLHFQGKLFLYPAVRRDFDALAASSPAFRRFLLTIKVLHLTTIGSFLSWQALLWTRGR